MKWLPPLRSFDLDLQWPGKDQDQKIAAFGSSYGDHRTLERTALCVSSLLWAVTPCSAHGNGPQVGLLSLQAATYTQVSAFIDFGIPTRKAITQVHPDNMEKLGFAAGSMGPKVQAACEFTRHTGKIAVIGSLSDIEAIVQGKAGTRVSTAAPGISYQE